jgi:hypothetical protein
LNLDYPDFEDAIQMISTLQCKAGYLITRNISDFQPPLVPVLKLVGFLAVLTYLFPLTFFFYPDLKTDGAL